MWHRIDDPDNPPPKDGTRILLWATHWGSQINVNTPLYVNRSVIGSRVEEDAEFRQEDELEWREDGGTYYCSWVTASHWQPLPPPPAEDTP